MSLRDDETEAILRTTQEAARDERQRGRRFNAEEIEKVRQGMIQRRERDHSSDTVRDDAPVLRGSYDESLWES